jgi:phage shock protein A
MTERPWPAPEIAEIDETRLQLELQVQAAKRSGNPPRVQQSSVHSALEALAREVVPRAQRLIGATGLERKAAVVGVLTSFVAEVEERIDLVPEPIEDLVERIYQEVKAAGRLPGALTQTVIE